MTAISWSVRGLRTQATDPSAERVRQAERGTHYVQRGPIYDPMSGWSAGEGVAVAIDVRFDFRTDAGGGDPDASRPTLQHYHHLLWSKALPSGRAFQLTPTPTKPYALRHESSLGNFYLTSDSVLATFTRRGDMQAIIGELPPADIDALDTITYTVGGMVLWPGNQIDRKWTINQARGCIKHIADRFDLTIECVRRHYEGDAEHPLAEVFERYRDFFDLFGTFAGYVEFWLLDDLVDTDGRVRLFLPSEDFTVPPVPQTLGDYLTYCKRTLDFVAARNKRIYLLGL